MKIWNVVEDEGLGGANARQCWFTSRKEAFACRAAWLNEHEAADGIFNAARVRIKQVEIPTTKAALTRWLSAYSVRAI